MLFEGSSPAVSDKSNIEFFDINSLIGRYFSVSNRILALLKANIVHEKNYSAITKLKKIMDPEGKIVEDSKTFFAVICIDKFNRRIGFLFRKVDEQVFLIGLWPKNFVDVIKNQKDFFMSFLTAITNEPDFWRIVDIVLP